MNSRVSIAYRRCRPSDTTHSRKEASEASSVRIGDARFALELELGVVQEETTERMEGEREDELLVP